jgi:hypothetical protein
MKEPRFVLLLGHGGDAVLDMLCCEGCGYAVCSCPVEDPWEHSRYEGAYPEIVRDAYKHKSGAVVWHDSEEPGVWRWGYDPRGGALCCSFWDAKQTLEEAQAAALALVP